MTHSYTYAILEVSPETYKEIRDLMIQNGYTNVFSEVDRTGTIDMTHVGLKQISQVSASEYHPHFGEIEPEPKSRISLDH